jgi:hypothetical protein
VRTGCRWHAKCCALAVAGDVKEHTAVRCWTCADTDLH